MKKLDKETYIQHAKRLQVILDEKSTFIPFLTRKDFNGVIQNELNVLAACEKLFPKLDLAAKYSSKSLVKDFNKLTKGSFKLDEKYKYEDQTDLIDAINYLVTFCNNMFRVNLDDLVAGKQVTATDPKIDLRAKPEMDDQGPRRNPNFAFAGAGIPLASTPQENPYFIGRAYAKVSDDIRNGKFYRYKTKPSIIPVAKIISIVCMMILILGLIVSAIFGFMASNAVIHVNDGDLPFGGIMNAVFYIVAGGFGIYPLYLVMSSMVGKNASNPNLKYYFNWPFVLIFLILALLFVLFDMIPLWIGNYEVVTQPSDPAYIGFYGLKYSLLVSTILVGLNVVPLIIGGVCNPKPDAAAIDAKIKQYIDLFSAESGQAPVPPKADVQKPVNVKEPKKDSKHKKDNKDKK